jgi:hypothetical protein
LRAVRRLLACLLLALSLGAAGPAAYAHALTHLGAPPASQQHDDEGDEHETGHACELCAAFGGVGALGAPPAPSTVAVASAEAPAAHPGHRLIPCEALARFASRAPPASR